MDCWFYPPLPPPTITRTWRHVTISRHYIAVSSAQQRRSKPRASRAVFVSRQRVLKCSEEKTFLEAAADMVSLGSLTLQRCTHSAASHPEQEAAGAAAWPAARGQRVLAAPWRWHTVGRAQNLKRSMKCCGDTGVEQRAGSVAVQGCPESWSSKARRQSFQKRVLQCRQKSSVSPYCSRVG